MSNLQYFGNDTLMPMETPDYSGKKILFTAFSIANGSEEVAGYDYIKRHGATDISALYWGGEKHAAQIPDDVTKIEITGNNQFDPEITAGYDLIFRHQSTRPDLLRSPSTTNTNEFFKYSSAPIVGVTGTKGKGTTSTLISLILDEAGVQNRLLGNMGNTAIAKLDEVKADDVVVFEISSFQLWDLEYSPRIAVALMMGVDHQDIHSSVDEYIEAKSVIVKHQLPDDLVVFHPTNEMTARLVDAARSRRKMYMDESGANVVDGNIVIDGQTIMKTSEVGLLGTHNLENVTAAITAAWEFTQDTEAIARAVSSFAGLEHRLEPVGEVGGVEFINDSFAAVPVATVAAVKAFEQPVSLIVGGYDKGTPFDEMADAIVQSSVTKVVAIGITGEQIMHELTSRGFENVEYVGHIKMPQVLKAAYEGMKSGSVVLLSPGCASFDMFESYKDRGNQFRQAVEEL